MKKLRDKESTRVNVSAITSYSKDYDLVPPSGKVDVIVMTLGSAVRKVKYNSQADRDADFDEIDKHFSIGVGTIQIKGIGTVEK